MARRRSTFTVGDHTAFALGVVECGPKQPVTLRSYILTRCWEPFTSCASMLKRETRLFRIFWFMSLICIPN